MDGIYHIYRKDNIDIIVLYYDIDPIKFILDNFDFDFC